MIALNGTHEVIFYSHGHGDFENKIMKNLNQVVALLDNDNPRNQSSLHLPVGKHAFVTAVDNKEELDQAIRGHSTSTSIIIFDEFVTTDEIKQFAKKASLKGISLMQVNGKNHQYDPTLTEGLNVDVIDVDMISEPKENNKLAAHILQNLMKSPQSQHLR